MSQLITIETSIHSSIEKVWTYYNTPEHITKWNNASEDWHTPIAENDLRAGGKFDYRMEAKDGSAGFDFSGTYDEVIENRLVKYTMDDGRKVVVDMAQENDETTKVKVTFEPEDENDPEFQKQGWQSILNNFKKYAESN